MSHVTKRVLSESLLHDFLIFDLMFKVVDVLASSVYHLMSVCLFAVSFVLGYFLFSFPGL